MDRIWIGLAGLFGAAAVAADAMAAHLIGEDGRRLNFALTAGRYALAHAVVLLVVALLYRSRASRCLLISGWCFVGGIVCFSGGLFVLASGVATLGPVVPTGGTLFIAGWIALAVHALLARAKT